MHAGLWMLLAFAATGLLVYMTIKLWPSVKATFFAGKLSFMFGVSEEEQRRLKNLVVKMNKEAFLLHCSRMNENDDFPGAFAIHNSLRDKWYVGASARVHDEIKGILHSNEEIHVDFHTGDYFSFRIVPLEGSGYLRSEELCRKLKATYTTGKKKY